MLTLWGYVFLSDRMLFVDLQYARAPAGTATISREPARQAFIIATDRFIPPGSALFAACGINSSAKIDRGTLSVTPGLPPGCQQFTTGTTLHPGTVIKARGLENATFLNMQERVANTTLALLSGGALYLLFVGGIFLSVMFGWWRLSARSAERSTDLAAVEMDDDPILKLAPWYLQAFWQVSVAIACAALVSTIGWYFLVPSLAGLTLREAGIRLGLTALIGLAMWMKWGSIRSMVDEIATVVVYLNGYLAYPLVHLLRKTFDPGELVQSHALQVVIKGPAWVAVGVVGGAIVIGGPIYLLKAMDYIMYYVFTFSTPKWAQILVGLTN